MVEESIRALTSMDRKSVAANEAPRPMISSVGRKVSFTIPWDVVISYGLSRNVWPSTLSAKRSEARKNTSPPTSVLPAVLGAQAP